MSLWKPPFVGAEPGWDECGCRRSWTTQPVPPVPPAPPVPPPAPSNQMRGSLTVQIGSDRVTVVFPTQLPLGTSYDIEVNTENTKTGDPDEQIFPSQIISRNNDGLHETGFTYGLNSAPTTGPGTGPDGTNSYTKFNWTINFYQ